MKTIYDVGFHIGQDAEYYLARGFRVVGIEANPVLVRQGEARFAEHIRAGRLVLLNVGIASTAGKFVFYVNSPHSEYSSFNLAIAQRDSANITEIEVQASTLADIIAHHGDAHYVKIDIEGFDHIAIESLRPTTIRPRFLSVENGFERDLDTLAALGYRRFAFVNQATVPSETVPPGSAEGTPVPWRFKGGASGLFGTDLGDRWVGYDEVLASIRRYWQNPNRDPVVDGWFDLHAALEDA